MSSLFRLPVKGELLWGATTRMQRRFPAIGPDIISTLLFGEEGHAVGKLFPQNLETFCRALAHEAKPSPAQVITENTLFPFVAPFLQPADELDARDSLLGKETRRALWTRTCHAAIGASPQMCMRYCPQCFQKDIAVYGTATWRCSHQIWHLKICPDHECDLIHTNVMLMDRHYVSLEQAAGTVPTASNAFASQLQTALARDVAYLASIPAVTVGQRKLRLACQIELKKAGGGIHGQGAVKKLRAALMDRFGADDLERSGASVISDRRAWQAVFNDTTYPVYLHHFSAVCQLIGIPFRKLLDTAASLGEPETAPWRCVSIGQACSGKRIIRGRVSKNGSFYFKCPQCGISYSRTTPIAQNVDSTFEYELVRTPDQMPWALELGTEWSNPTHTWSSLTKRFNCSRRVLLVRAARLHLPDMKGRSLAEGRRYLATFGQKRAHHEKTRRPIFEAFVREHPNATARNLPPEMKKIYAWLRKNDPDPLPKLAVTNINLGAGRRPAGTAARDEELARMIRNGAAEAMTKLKFRGAPRVSRKTLLRYFAFQARIPLGALPAMPHTTAALNELIETVDQRKQRRVDELISGIDSLDILPAWGNFFTQNGIARLDVHHLAQVRSAYVKRRAINPRRQGNRQSKHSKVGQF